MDPYAIAETSCGRFDSLVRTRGSLRPRHVVSVMTIVPAKNSAGISVFDAVPNSFPDDDGNKRMPELAASLGARRCQLNAGNCQPCAGIQFNPGLRQVGDFRTVGRLWTIADLVPWAKRRSFQTKPSRSFVGLGSPVVSRENRQVHETSAQWPGFRVPIGRARWEGNWPNSLEIRS